MVIWMHSPDALRVKMHMCLLYLFTIFWCNEVAYPKPTLWTTFIHMKTNKHNVVHMTVMRNVGFRLCVRFGYTYLSPFHHISLASIPYSLLTSFILPVAGCHNTCILASTHKLAIYGRLLGSLHLRECLLFIMSEYYGVSRFFHF